MRIKPVVIGGLVFLVLLLATFKIYTSFHRPVTHAINEDMAIIGIIDQDNSQKVTQYALLNGEDSILVVDHATTLYQEITQKIPQAKHLGPEDIFHVNNLHLFDKTQSGLLTAKDPIFKHLLIIRFYDKGRQNDLKTLPEAGIKGIFTYTKTTGDYEVLMVDGTLRTLYSFSKVENK